MINGMRHRVTCFPLYCSRVGISLSSRYPEVTYLLPISKDLKYLNYCLSSFIHEDYPCFRIKVVVNGTLITLREVQEIVQKFEQSFQIEVVAVDGGLVEALNFGIQTSASKYIARIDADDAMIPGRTRSQVKVLEKDNEIGVIGGQAVLINASGEKIGDLNYLVGKFLVSWRMKTRCAVGHPFVMFRRELVESVGGYRSTSFPAEDYDLWTRLLSKTKFTNLPFPVGEHRKHDNQVSVVYLEAQMDQTIKINGQKNVLIPLGNLRTSIHRKLLKTFVRFRLFAYTFFDWTK